MLQIVFSLLSISAMTQVRIILCINTISHSPARKAPGNSLACVRRVIRYAAIRVMTTELTITILANIKTVFRASSRKPLFIHSSSSSSTGPIACGSHAIRTRGLRDSAALAETRLRSVQESSRRVNAGWKHLRWLHCHFLRAISARQRRKDARSLAKFGRGDIGVTCKHRIHKASRLFGARWPRFLADVRDGLPGPSVHVARRITCPEIRSLVESRERHFAGKSSRDVKCAAFRFFPPLAQDCACASSTNLLAPCAGNSYLMILEICNI